MPKKGLGKGLDSLIPEFYDEDFDSNSTQSLEDMLAEEKTVEEVVEEIPSGDKDDIGEKIEEDETSEDGSSSEEVHGITGDEESVSIAQDPQVQENVEEVKAIVNKNPRITLWSSRSAAVFRYLRKTEPEFSISKEASILIDEAVSKKYPEIWELFDED